MSRKPVLLDGEIISRNEGVIIKGHVSVEDYNEIVDEEERPHATAVRHYYARCIPAPPGSEYPFYIWDWGKKPSRGAFKATEALELEEEGTWKSRLPD